MKNKHRFKSSQLKYLLVLGVVFVVCLTSVGTLSWYIVTKRNEGKINAIKVEKGIGLEGIYGFAGNYRLDESGLDKDVGYTPSPTLDLQNYDAFSEADPTLATSPLFLDIESKVGASAGLMSDATNLKPDTKFAFAFVVTTDSKIDRFLTLNLAQYSCGFNYTEVAGTLTYPKEKLSDGSERIIYLSQAIVMCAQIYPYDENKNLDYGKAFVLGNSLSDTVSTPLVNSFIDKTGNPIADGGDNILANMALTSAKVATNTLSKYVIFFSIEFSDASSTYFSKNSDGTYSKDPNGNSNVYSDAYFDIDQLSISYLPELIA